MIKEELKNRVLNGGRGSGRTIRLLCEAYENKIAQLEQQIEKMKCCGNCNNTWNGMKLDICADCKNFNKWKLRR